MSNPVSDLQTLLRTLDPRLHDGVYVFSSVPFETDLSSIPFVATFREDEGLTIILSEEDAIRAGFPILLRAAWITLKVHSSLQAIGLTAAFSAELTRAGISCNVVAGAHHDHVFVPVDRATDAMETFRQLGSTA